MNSKPLPTGTWYFFAICIPLVGFILGIIAMARSQVGPGLALWACAMASWIVAVVVMALGAS